MTVECDAEPFFLCPLGYSAMVLDSVKVSLAPSLAGCFSRNSTWRPLDAKDLHLYGYVCGGSVVRGWGLGSVKARGQTYLLWGCVFQVR